MLSFIEARGGGTSLWSSTRTAPSVILFKHYEVSSVSCNLVSWSAETNLVNDPQTLPEFLDTAHVAVVAVTVLSDRNVELDLFVCKFSCHQRWFARIHTSSYLS